MRSAKRFLANTVCVGLVLYGESYGSEKEDKKKTAKAIDE